MTQIINWRWVKSSIKSLQLRGNPAPENQRNSIEDLWWEETNCFHEIPARKNVFAARGIYLFRELIKNMCNFSKPIFLRITGIVDFDEGNRFTSLIRESSIFSVSTCESYV